MRRLAFVSAAVGAVCFLAAGAGAQTVYFEDRDLDFNFIATFDGDDPPFKRLDITKSAADNLSAFNGGGPAPAWAVRYDYFASSTSSDPTEQRLRGVDLGAARYVVDASPTVIFDEDGLDYHYSFASRLNMGDTVGPGDNFNSTAYVGAYFITNHADNGADLRWDTYFVGMEITLGTGVHYGWVEFELYALDTYRAVAWGYNATAGEAAMIVPAPGAAVMLAGGIALLGARRRRD